MRFYFILILMPFLVFAQQKPKKIKNLNANKIQRIPEMYEGNLLYSGNVIFEHENTKLKADSVVFYEKENYIQAFSNVYVDMQGNDLQSDELIYDGNTQIGRALGNVILRDSEQTLYTDKLEYDRKINQAYYNTGGIIVTKENTIQSKAGTYDMNSKKNSFDGDVEITNKEYFITSSNVEHSSDNDYLYFYDNTIIQSRENPKRFIRTSKGEYNLKTEEAFLENRSSVHVDGKSIIANNLYYNQLSGYGKGIGEVLIDDPEEKRFIKGEYGEIFKEIDSAYVTINALAVRAFEEDSIYLHADTLMMSKRNNKGFIRAFHDAKFFKSNLQGKADSISFSENSGEIHFYKEPIIWSGFRQITGDSITVYSNVKTEELDSITVKRNAFAISKTDSLTTEQFHQLKSREMLGLFVDEALDWVQAEGNAQSLIYYIEEDKEGNPIELVGINRSDCGIIEVDFEERLMNITSCKIKASSKFYPASKFPKQQRFLPNFIWREKERPKKWRDIFLVNNNE